MSVFYDIVAVVVVAEQKHTFQRAICAQRVKDLMVAIIVCVCGSI